MEEVLLENVRGLVLPLLAARGVELVDLVLVRKRSRFILRFLVTRPEGITLDECARLNREISQIFDRENIIQESYFLEVSSPGLDRPLVNSRDFQRCRGQLIKVVLREPIDRQNVWVGLMNEVNDENVIIQTEKQEKLSIPRRNIARANLEVRL